MKGRKKEGMRSCEQSLPQPRKIRVIFIAYRGVLRLDNKKLIDLGIQMLQGVDINKAESIDIGRTVHSDGSVTHSINVMLPEEEPAEKAEEKNGFYIGGPVHLDAKTIVTAIAAKCPERIVPLEDSEPIEKVTANTFNSDLKCTQDIETEYRFKHDSRYLVIDLGEPDERRKTMSLRHNFPIHTAFKTDSVN